MILVFKFERKLINKKKNQMNEKKITEDLKYKFHVH